MSKVAEIYVKERTKRCCTTITRLYQGSGDTEWIAIKNLVMQLEEKRDLCTYFQLQTDTFCIYEGRKLGRLFSQIRTNISIN